MKRNVISGLKSANFISEIVSVFAPAIIDSS